MRTLTKLLCCGILIATGYSITQHVRPSVTSDQQNTLRAATVPNWNVNGQPPLDYILDQAKRLKTDTVYVEIHDTVIVNNVKYVRVPVPSHTTDTIYVPMADLPEIEVLPVKNKSPGDENAISEENTDSVTTGVILIIDGRTVYSSKASDEP